MRLRTTRRRKEGSPSLNVPRRLHQSELKPPVEKYAQSRPSIKMEHPSRAPIIPSLPLGRVISGRLRCDKRGAYPSSSGMLDGALTEVVRRLGEGLARMMMSRSCFFVHVLFGRVRDPTVNDSEKTSFDDVFVFDLRAGGAYFYFENIVRAVVLPRVFPSI